MFAVHDPDGTAWRSSKQPEPLFAHAAAMHVAAACGRASRERTACRATGDATPRRGNARGVTKPDF
jgi:hypothetical protein